ncbi:hypothetical protein SprV_0100271600 [Sparganum proliferum]
MVTLSTSTPPSLSQLRDRQLVWHSTSPPLPDTYTAGVCEILSASLDCVPVATSSPRPLLASYCPSSTAVMPFLVSADKLQSRDESTAEVSLVDFFPPPPPQHMPQRLIPESTPLL